MGNEKNYGAIFLIAFLLPIIVFLSHAEEAEAGVFDYSKDFKFDTMVDYDCGREHFNHLNGAALNLPVPSEYGKKYIVLYSSTCYDKFYRVTKSVIDVPESYDKPIEITYSKDDYGHDRHIYSLKNVNELNGFRGVSYSVVYSNSEEPRIEESNTFSTSLIVGSQRETFFGYAIGESPSVTFRFNGEDFKQPIIDDNKNFVITYPSNGSKIAGYQGSDGGAYMDIKVKGSFPYTPEWYEFNKMIQTSIINSTIFRLDGETRVMGTGLGLKRFDWIQSPRSNEVIFEMVLTAPLLKKGENLELTVGCSVPSNDPKKIARAESYNYISDTITISTTQNMQDSIVDGYKPPNEENGETDGKLESGHPLEDMWEGLPSRPTNDSSILDWIKWGFDTLLYWITLPFKLIVNMLSSIVDVLTDFISSTSNLFTLFSTMFSFLPKDISSILMGALVLMVTTSLFSFLRR